jgi:methylmalonyl-CoA mutase cobalamin-binding subunit
MARFISVCRASISNNSGSPTAIITGATNSSGIPASTYGVILSILASNKNVNAQNVTVQLIKDGSTTASLITSGIIPQQSSLEFMTGNKMIVEPGDWIKAYASAASSIDITVSYMLNPQDTSI